jgi:hypothetical protein
VFNDHVHIILLYLTVPDFYLLKFGFVPLFYILFLFIYLFLFKNEHKHLSDITLLNEQGYIYYY